MSEPHNYSDDEAYLSSPIIHGRKRMISLLTGGVPDLEFYSSVIQTDGLSKKSSTDGRLLIFVELSLYKSEN